MSQSYQWQRAASKETLTDMQDSGKHLEKSIATASSLDLSEETWKMYLELSSTVDKQSFKRLNDDLDTLLLFATLFSAIVTAFVIEYYHGLAEGDPSVTALKEIVFALQANRTLEPDWRAEAHPYPSHSHVVITACWFASLLLSLLTAFFAILMKQWIFELKNSLDPDGPSIEQARRRQFNYDNATQWYIYPIVTSLPVLVHVSLLLFCVALVEFIAPLDLSAVAIMIAVFVYTTVFLYVVAHLLSTIWTQCPYRTSLTTFIQTLPFLTSRMIVSFASIPRVLHHMSCGPWRRTTSMTGYWAALLDSMVMPNFKFDFYRIKTIRVDYHIGLHENEIDVRVLAWLFRHSSHFDESLTLADELCRGAFLERDKELFIESGALALLGRQLRFAVVRFERLPQSANPGQWLKPQTDILLCCTAILRLDLGTEVGDEFCRRSYAEEHLKAVRETVKLANVYLTSNEDKDISIVTQLKEIKCLLNASMTSRQLSAVPTMEV